MKIIGRRDVIDLPDLQLTGIEAKVDTGAYGNALHCHHIELMMKDNVETLRFKLLDPSHPEYEDRYFYFSEFNEKKVKSSSGQVENRYTIKTRLTIFDNNFTTQFSLTDRQEMKYPVLLGRKFLRKKFIVDVSLKNVSHKAKHQVK